MYEQQQQSLVKDATNRTTPTAALPSISLRSSTSTPSSSHHPPASALRLSSRPLSEHLSSASMASAAVASPRVRFNLEPMHFEFSDVDDISEDPTTSFKLRDRSPSDPLISLGETIDLRNRLNIYHTIFVEYHGPDHLQNYLRNEIISLEKLHTFDPLYFSYLSIIR